MSNEEIKVTIVIVTYNRYKLLKECISCVEQQSSLVNSIVVVDNNSTDETKEYLASLNGKGRYHIVSLTENIGGAGGYYYGIKEAVNCDGEWIILIDDDAMLAGDFVKHIKESIKKYPQYSAFSGTVLVDGEIDISHRRLILSKRRYRIEKVGKLEYEKENFPCDLASFCGLVIDKKIIKKIGLPKKEYFIWYDDTEYSYRINQYTKVLNINDAIINHKTKISRSYLGWKSYYGKRNEIDILRKYYPKTVLYWNVTKRKLRSIYNAGKYLMKGDYKNAIFTICVYSDAIRDGLNGKLGKNTKYLP